MDKIYKLSFLLFIFLGLTTTIVLAQGEPGNCSLPDVVECGCPANWDTQNWGEQGNGARSFTIANGCLCQYTGGGNYCGADDSALPVEFLYFNAEQQPKGIQLNWATASEINNDFFSVEYSRDGVAYKEIARVDGHGNSVETIEYDFMHDTPNVGFNYYRLRQQDFDGTFEYSDVVLINRNGDQNVSVRNTMVNAEVNVIVNKAYEQDTRIVVYDLLGNQVLEGTFPAQNNQHVLNIADLPTGHYFLTVEDNHRERAVRFVKVEI